MTTPDQDTSQELESARIDLASAEAQLADATDHLHRVTRAVLEQTPAGRRLLAGMVTDQDTLETARAVVQDEDVAGDERASVQAALDRCAVLEDMALEAGTIVEELTE